MKPSASRNPAGPSQWEPIESRLSAKPLCKGLTVARDAARLERFESLRLCLEIPLATSTCADKSHFMERTAKMVFSSITRPLTQSCQIERSPCHNMPCHHGATPQPCHTPHHNMLRYAKPTSMSLVS